MLDNLRSLYGIIEYERCLEVDIRRDGFLLPIIIGVVCSVVFFFAGYVYRRNIAEAKVAKAEDAVKK